MKKRGSSSLGKIAVKSGFSDLHAFADLANREAAILVHGFELADACGIQFRFASAVASASAGRSESDQGALADCDPESG